MVGQPRCHGWCLGLHRLAKPLQWVGSGWGTGWRKLACGKQKLYLLYVSA
jgi:hypothetical protein